MASLGLVDIVIVALSLLFVFVAAIFGAVRYKTNNNHAEEYFLAGRSMSWIFIAASLFASNIGVKACSHHPDAFILGAEQFVGLAGSAALSGLPCMPYELVAGLLILVMGWLFAPVYLKAKLTTIPEYLERRFNKYCRLLYVLMTMIVYVAAKIGTTLYAGSILLEVVAGIPIWESTPLIIVVTASYTIIGGLTAVMLTDTIQTFIFVLGGLVGTGYALHLVGGLYGMFDILSRDDVGLDRFRHIWHSSEDRDYPWPGMLIGIPVVSIWYWCIDQEMMQRILSARSLQHARMGAASAALFKTVSPFITAVPGVVARTLFELCRADPTGNTFPQWCSPSMNDAHDADKAYPLLVLREFPRGVKGLLVAAFIAATMSSLSSVFNSASTIFTYDVYERFIHRGPLSSDRLVCVGRVITIILTFLTFCWLPVVHIADRGLFIVHSFRSFGIYDCLQVGQQVMTHLVPSASALFVCGIFVPIANGVGAVSGFSVGLCIGIIRYILFFIFQDYCDEHVDASSNEQMLNWFNWTVCLNHNYFAIILFVFIVMVICLVSLFTKRPSQSKIQDLLSDLVIRKSRSQLALPLNCIDYGPIEDVAVETFSSENEPSSSVAVIDRSDGTSDNGDRCIWQVIKKIFWIEEGYAAIWASVVAVGVITALLVLLR